MQRDLVIPAQDPAVWLTKTSARWGRRRVVDDHNLLWLLGGEKQGNEPADKRNSDEDVDDDNSRRMRAVSFDRYDGGQEIDVQN